MQTAIRLHTKILPGRRLEITAPELPDEGEVELLILLPELHANGTKNGAATETTFAVTEAKTGGSVREYLRSLPRIERTAEQWAQIEREFQEERNSWER